MADLMTDDTMTFDLDDRTPWSDGDRADTDDAGPASTDADSTDTDDRRDAQQVRIPFIVHY